MEAVLGAVEALNREVAVGGLMTDEITIQIIMEVRLHCCCCVYHVHSVV